MLESRKSATVPRKRNGPSSRLMYLAAFLAAFEALLAVEAQSPFVDAIAALSLIVAVGVGIFVAL